MPPRVGTSVVGLGVVAVAWRAWVLGLLLFLPVAAQIIRWTAPTGSPEPHSRHLHKVSLN